MNTPLRPSEVPDQSRPTPSRRVTRATFLARASLAGAAAVVAAGRSLGAVSAAVAATRPEPRKNQPKSRVSRWDIITIGNLSRNRYWGESDAKGVRAAICTCTVVAGDDFRLLVDPSLADVDQMARELDRRTGLKPQDITAVFVTHEHGDHHAGLAHFPNARWLAAPGVAEVLNGSGRLGRRVETAAGLICDTVEVIPTPGHTRTHHSLHFDCDGRSVVVAGDAVPARDFFRERRGYYNAVDLELSARTMDKLAVLADIIVPGHDNCFLVNR